MVEMGAQFGDHLEPAATSNVRYPNLSHYGSEHPADVALGMRNIAKRLHAESTGGVPTSEEIMAESRNLMRAGHVAGTPRMGGGVEMEEPEEEEG